MGSYPEGIDNLTQQLHNININDDNDEGEDTEIQGILQGNLANQNTLRYIRPRQLKYPTKGDKRQNGGKRKTRRRKMRKKKRTRKKRRKRRRRKKQRKTKKRRR